MPPPAVRPWPGVVGGSPDEIAGIEHFMLPAGTVCVRNGCEFVTRTSTAIACRRLDWLRITAPKAPARPTAKRTAAVAVALTGWLAACVILFAAGVLVGGALGAAHGGSSDEAATRFAGQVGVFDGREGEGVNKQSGDRTARPDVGGR